MSALPHRISPLSLRMNHIGEGNEIGLSKNAEADSDFGIHFVFELEIWHASLWIRIRNIYSVI
jgi:hypothetical protein